MTRIIKKIVFAKTGGHCWYCGQELDPFGTWQIDHQQPRSQGGADDIDNLVAACRRCNNRKGGRTIEQFRIYLQARMENKTSELLQWSYGFVEEWEDIAAPDTFTEFLKTLSEAAVQATHFWFVFYGESLPDVNGETVKIDLQAEGVS